MSTTEETTTEDEDEDDEEDDETTTEPPETTTSDEVSYQIVMSGEDRKNWLRDMDGNWFESHEDVQSYYSDKKVKSPRDLSKDRLQESVVFEDETPDDFDTYWHQFWDPASNEWSGFRGENRKGRSDKSAGGEWNEYWDYIRQSWTGFWETPGDNRGKESSNQTTLSSVDRPETTTQLYETTTRVTQSKPVTEAIKRDIADNTITLSSGGSETTTPGSEQATQAIKRDFADSPITLSSVSDGTTSETVTQAINRGFADDAITLSSFESETTTPGSDSNTETGTESIKRGIADTPITLGPLTQNQNSPSKESSQKKKKSFSHKRKKKRPKKIFVRKKSHPKKPKNKLRVVKKKKKSGGRNEGEGPKQGGNDFEQKEGILGEEEIPHDNNEDSDDQIDMDEVYDWVMSSDQDQFYDIFDEEPDGLEIEEKDDEEIEETQEWYPKHKYDDTWTYHVKPEFKQRDKETDHHDEGYEQMSQVIKPEFKHYDRIEVIEVTTPLESSLSGHESGTLSDDNVSLQN